MADTGELGLVKQHLGEQSKEALLNEKDADGRTPLHWAASADEKLGIVETLFEAGPVHIDERDSGGWTPLMIAASAGASRVVGFLLRQYVFLPLPTAVLTQWSGPKCGEQP